MSEEHFWKAILAELEKDNRLVLVVIINQTGSAPNSPGAKMFVTLENSMGTVGGGMSEHQLFNHARSMIQKGQDGVESKYMEHRETAGEHGSGMICSGSQSFALVPLNRNNKPTIENIVEAIAKAKPGLLSINKLGMFFEKNQEILDSWKYEEKDDLWEYKETIAKLDKIYIIGAGHVSLALSRIMETLNFYIVVLDNRKNLPTMDTNSYAHEKKVVNYEELTNLIPEGNNIYVTIMTYGHSSDEQVLEMLLSKNFYYIGMMASKPKSEQIFSNLRKKGVSDELLKKVHSPIGLKIKSITPEEIAISIAAEIIKARNFEKKKDK